ncbi:mercury resistance system periplasmic binding protein MerP [Pseudomonas lalucatii]|uniref:Periplasmic mercury ion-binding protein n=1 Tax=Pseudomonas lalucatii TaxID=1424203 RepID=A0ABS5Q510_9PSED|nr:mercury resistance system periplasmic binding protein MerP [Pseudomonas lalucatii]MBS7663209.1 mercury resistance system periplasmic binding protein MerP [Pseudomonas lalucatii]MBS7689960.1 mercury resistance system periplasmic binding protein MerP [Pseudomonas lalucatii]MBS7724888.1 mercury resistance system periplasmic binding protein MerP [Pseudomonas lalucatii]QVM87135.1 mercury resistance system periplasmic binding protein MerP [Pseudomonas lalucatii]
MRNPLLTMLLTLPLMAAAETPNPVTLEIPNMNCGLCPITVKQALQKVPGVENVRIDFERKTASVRYDPDRVQPEALIEATGNAGYPATLQE